MLDNSKFFENKSILNIILDNYIKMKSDIKLIPYLKNISKLNDFSKEVHVCDSLNQLYDCFINNLQKIYSKSKGEFLILDSKINDFIVYSNWSFETNFLSVELKIPIIINNKLILKINLFLDKAANQKLVFDMIDHFIIAYKNIVDKFNYHKEANYDFLTGLYNRRYLKKSLVKEESLAKKYQESLGVIFIDIDYFKKINDFYGHDAGDEVLKNVGNCLVHNVNKNDIVFRYGGEEFMIISPNISKENTEIKSNKLLGKLKNLDIYYDTEKINITVSIGSSVLIPNEKNNTISDVIKAADNALYQAKNKGRDCVVCL